VSGHLPILLNPIIKLGVEDLDLGSPFPTVDNIVDGKLHAQLGCSDFDFFHILRYNHPSLTP
jgi:hypothetical protein